MANVVQVNDENFVSEVLESKVPVLVDFYATWCGPCQSLSPIVEELARDYAGKLKVSAVDIDVSHSTPSRYGIMAVPTLILFKNGKEMEKITGFKPKADLRKRIDAVLAA